MSAFDKTFIVCNPDICDSISPETAGFLIGSSGVCGLYAYAAATIFVIAKPQAKAEALALVPIPPTTHTLPPTHPPPGAV